MTALVNGDRLRAIRIGLALTQTEFGRVLGYRAERPSNIHILITRMENGQKIITPQVQRLALMLEFFGLPDELKSMLWSGSESGGQDGPGAGKHAAESQDRPSGVPDQAELDAGMK